MKRTFILSCLGILLSLGLNAQTEKGRLITGLSSNLNLSNSSLMGISFGSSKYHSDDPNFQESASNQVFTINLNPRVGYFLIDNLAIGLDLTYSYNQEKNGESSNLYKQSAFTGGPFLRYYYPLNESLLFGEVYGSYGKLLTSYDYTDNSLFEDTEYETLILNYGLAVGLSFPLTDMTFFDCAIGYNAYKFSPQDDDSEYDEYTTQQGLNLKLGFSIFLGE